MVEAPLQDDIQRRSQLHCLKNTQGERDLVDTEMWCKKGGVLVEKKRFYLILKIRNDDIEMHQDWQEGAAACLRLLMILYRKQRH